MRPLEMKCFLGRRYERSTHTPTSIDLPYLPIALQAGLKAHPLAAAGQLARIRLQNGNSSSETEEGIHG